MSHKAEKTTTHTPRGPCRSVVENTTRKPMQSASEPPETPYDQFGEPIQPVSSES